MYTFFAPFTMCIYSDDCEEVPIRGTCTRKSLEATRLPPSSFAGSERASSSEVRASVEGCRALSFCPQNPTRSMPCEERSCVKSDLGDSASKPNCSCLTWPQIFFSILSSTTVVSTCRLSFNFKIQGRELYSPFPLRDGNSTPVLNALLKIKIKIKIKTTVGSIFIGRVLCVPFINSDKLGIKLKLKLWSVARKLFQNYLWI